MIRRLLLLTLVVCVPSAVFAQAKPDALANNSKPTNAPSTSRSRRAISPFSTRKRCQRLHHQRRRSSRVKNKGPGSFRSRARTQSEIRDLKSEI